MAFEVAQSKQAPENTTVSNYSVSRLTGIQYLRTQMSETRRGWVPVVVLRAADTNSDGVFEELDVQPVDPGYAHAPSDLLGRVLLNEVGATVGTVETAEAVPPTPASPEHPGAPGYWKLTLAASGGLPSADAVTLESPHINFFGAQVNNPVPSGRSWDLELSSAVPEQAARMQAMMFRIQVNFIMMALAALGVTKTPEEVQAAALTMMQQGNSIDSVIASEMEQLEKDRRSGALTAVTVIGPAPVVN